MLLLVAALAFGWGGNVANAKTFEVDSIALEPGNSVTATVGGRLVYIGAQVMTGPDGTLLFFCVDPLGTNYLGAQNPPLLLNWASTWSGVTAAQAGTIQDLANLSRGASWQENDAIDVAIIETLGFSVTGISDPWVETRAATLFALAGTTTPGGFWIPSNAPYAGFAQVGVTAVPELSTWAMMLTGFIGLGFAGYRRQKLVVA